MKVVYSPHHRPHAEGHIFIDKPGACTIELTGAASMTQEELDGYGRLFAAALASPAPAPAEPVMWVCLVPNPLGELRIRAWTADRKRMESLRAEGLDMQPLYASPVSSPDHPEPPDTEKDERINKVLAEQDERARFLLSPIKRDK